MIKYAHLHYSICKKVRIETTENRYSHIPMLGTEHEGITVLWNQGVKTDREVLTNRPDIIVKKQEGQNLPTDWCSNTIR
jgi:hypothetical protein